VWDADSGLEFANDLIANVTEYVIPCSVMDSIDEPRTAWKEGELDPIAIKSDGRFDDFFPILFFKDIFFFCQFVAMYRSTQSCCTDACFSCRENGCALAPPSEKRVREVFIIHVEGTRYVTSSTDQIMKIHARITWNVEFIRACIFIFLFYV
jgi:hypothetical protein